MKNHLINILQDFREFTEKHIMLKSYMDNVLDDKSMENVLFPLLYVEQGIVDLVDGQITINMTIYVSDLLNPDRSNFINVINNMLLIGIDFNDYFRNSKDDQLCGYHVIGSTMTPGRFNFGQESCGYQFDVDVIIKHSISKDNVPLEE